MYTTGLEPDIFALAVGYRPQIRGLFRSVWLTILAMVALLAVSRVFVNRVLGDGANEAVVALLLAAPSTLAIYLAGPAENGLLSESLRGLRYLTALAGAIPYMVSGMLLLRFRHEFPDVLLAATLVEGAIFLVVSHEMLRAWLDNRARDRRPGTHEVAILDWSRYEIW